MHYVNVDRREWMGDEGGDTSGIYVWFTRVPRQHNAGVISLHVNTNVPPLSRSFQDVVCQLNEEKVSAHMVRRAMQEL